MSRNDYLFSTDSMEEKTSILREKCRACCMSRYLPGVIDALSRLYNCRREGFRS